MTVWKNETRRREICTRSYRYGHCGVAQEEGALRSKNFVSLEMKRYDEFRITFVVLFSTINSKELR